MEYLNMLIENWRHIAGFVVLFGGIWVCAKVNTGATVNQFTSKRRF